jgi:protein-tyrosine phosphatase
MLHDFDSRVLTLLGADNARDLGGLPTADGRSTRRGLIYRAALIPELLPDDVDLLVRRVGLRTVIDLRTQFEVDAVTSRWAEHAVNWLHCPIYIGRREPIGERSLDYADAYIEYLTGDPEPALRAVRTLLDPDALPALFHCAAGKDRTGVIAALLQDVLGVPHPTIAEDYALTVRALPAIIERLATLPPYSALRQTTIAEHIPEAETMHRFLRRLTDEFGGAEGWLRGHGVDDAHLYRFRAELIV